MAHFDLGEESEAALRDHFPVPGRLHKGDALRPCKARVLGSLPDRFGRGLDIGRVFCVRLLRGLIHGVPLLMVQF